MARRATNNRRGGGIVVGQSMDRAVRAAHGLYQPPHGRLLLLAIPREFVDVEIEIVGARLYLFIDRRSQVANAVGLSLERCIAARMAAMRCLTWPSW